MRTLSCGLLVTDGAHLLIGHATRSPRWDIPKGMAEPSESPEATARRELAEETGLAAPEVLEALGQFAYLPRKDLFLFAWQVETMPDPASLVCRSTFLIAGKPVPEFDRFACPRWTEAIPRLGKSMAAVVRSVVERKGWADQ